jgi:hypothetical protein
VVCALFHAHAHDDGHDDGHDPGYDRAMHPLIRNHGVHARILQAGCFLKVAILSFLLRNHPKMSLSFRNSAKRL